MSHDEMIVVLEAHQDGKDVEWRGIAGEWIPWRNSRAIPTVTDGHEWRVNPYTVRDTGTTFRGEKIYISGDKRVAKAFYIFLQSLRPDDYYLCENDRRPAGMASWLEYKQYELVEV